MLITMKELSYISKLYEGISPISILANMTIKEEGSELFSLMEKGIIQEDELGLDSRPLMDIIANTRQSTKVYIKDRFCEIEKYTCRSEGGLVMVEHRGENLDITMPRTLKSVSDELKEWVGCSSLKSVQVDGVFTHGELVVLAAFIDLYRGIGLKVYLGEDIEMRGVTAYEVYNSLKKDSDNQLAGMLITNYQLTVPEMSELSDLIEKLIEKGCLIKGKEVVETDFSVTYELTEAYALLASGFLVPETLMTLEQLGYNPEGELISSSSLCIGAGHRDLLMIAFGETDAELATLSSSELLLLIQNLLSCPKVL